MSLPVRLGLLGAGRWGRAYIQTIRALPGVTLSRVASRRPETGTLVGAECAVTPDWRAVAEADDLDGIIVATPPGLHAEMTAAAVAAGHAVLVEKPLTMSLTEAERLREFVARRHGLVIVDHTQLWNPAYEVLRALAPSLGLLRSVRSEAGGPGPFRVDVPVLWDWGAHDVALCLDLLAAEPLETTAVIEERRRTPDGFRETVLLRLSFSGGCDAELRVSNLLPHRRRSFTVELSGGALSFSSDDAGIVRRRTATDAERLPVTAEPPLTRVVRYFASAIEADARELRSLDLGVAVVSVLARCAAVARPTAR